MCIALAPLLDELFTFRLLAAPVAGSLTDVYSHHEQSHGNGSPQPTLLQQLAASFVLVEIIKGAGRLNSSNHDREHIGKLEPFAEYIIQAILATPAWELQSSKTAIDDASEQHERTLLRRLAFLAAGDVSNIKCENLSILHRRPSFRCVS